MIRAGLVAALTAALLLLTAPAASAHATCSSHTHWASLTNYTVTHGCSGVVRKLTWRGWVVVGYFSGG